MIVELENNPFHTKLSRSTIPYEILQCLGEHAVDLPIRKRRLIKASRTSDAALRKLEKAFLEDYGGELKAIIGTTQAIDLIKGGVKINALPESANAVVNHRIATDRCVQFYLDGKMPKCL